MNNKLQELELFLLNSSRKDLSEEIETNSVHEIKFPKKGDKKVITFNTTIKNIPTGISDIILKNYFKENITSLKKEPDQFIFYRNLLPVYKFPELARNGKNKEEKSKLNNYKIGTLVNAQIISATYYSQEDKQIPVIFSSMSPNGKEFFKNLGFTPIKLLNEGTPLELLYIRSIEAALSAGFNIQ